MRRALVGMAAAAAIIAGGCGGSDGVGGPTAPPGSGASSTAASAAPGTTAGSCAGTRIEVKAGTRTAEIDGTTAYADIIGTDAPQSATFTIANYAIPEGDARGVLQPSALQPGQAVVLITATAPTIDTATYPDQTGAGSGDHGVIFFSLVTEDGRALPTARHTVTVTEVGPDHVCGSIAPEGSTTGATATGTFRARRIDQGRTTATR